MTLPAAGIEPLRRRAAHQAPDKWLVKDLVIPVPGAWNIEVKVLVSDFESVRISATLDIK